MLAVAYNVYHTNPQMYRDGKRRGKREVEMKKAKYNMLQVMWKRDIITTSV